MGNLCSGGRTSDPKYENPKKLKKVKNVIKMLDHGEADKDGRTVKFIVFEYIDGQDLFDFLKEKGHFTAQMAINIYSRIMKVL